jgi:hypothetical protein
VSETKTPPATIADCDRKIFKAWRALRDDPKADAEDCRRAIDVWLDARLILMRRRDTT